MRKIEFENFSHRKRSLIKTGDKLKHIKSGVIVTFDRWADSEMIYFHAKEMELKHFNVVLHIAEFVKEKPKTISVISRHGENSKQRFWAMESEETGIMLWNEDPKKWEFLKFDKKKP